MKIYLAFLLLLFSTLSFSQNTLTLGEKNSPKVSIEDVSWISGYWIGEALGGKIEEVWTEPLGGSMMGSFKLVVDFVVFSFNKKHICSVIFSDAFLRTCQDGIVIVSGTSWYCFETLSSVWSRCWPFLVWENSSFLLSSLELWTYNSEE